MKHQPADEDDDEMLPEYDFSKGVRGKYAAAYREGHSLPDWNRQPDTIKNKQWQYVVGLAVLGLFAVILLWVVFSFLQGAMGNALESEGEAIVQTLDAFMQAMAVGDTDSAAAHLANLEYGPLDEA